tara:strand:+ start:181 stop:369 length:189 start_codon:yes stop_codon:yes gene_type:complete
LVQPNTTLGQRVDVWGANSRIEVTHIMPTEVINQDYQDIRISLTVTTDDHSSRAQWRGCGER